MKMKFVAELAKDVVSKCRESLRLKSRGEYLRFFEAVYSYAGSDIRHRIRICGYDREDAMRKAREDAAACGVSCGLKFYSCEEV